MPYFAFLIVTAVLLYYAKFPILVVAAVVFFFISPSWLCQLSAHDGGPDRLLIAVARPSVTGTLAVQRKHGIALSIPELQHWLAQPQGNIKP